MMQPAARQCVLTYPAVIKTKKSNNTLAELLWGCWKSKCMLLVSELINKCCVASHVQC